MQRELNACCSDICSLKKCTSWLLLFLQSQLSQKKTTVPLTFRLLVFIVFFRLRGQFLTTLRYTLQENKCTVILAKIVSMAGLTAALSKADKR